MAFGKKASDRGTELRAYVYGCSAPLAYREEVRTAMRERVLLWNRLVELERLHRDAIDALIALHVTAPQVTRDEMRARKRASKEKPDDAAAQGALQEGLRYLAERKVAFRLDAVREELSRMEKETVHQAWEIAKAATLSYCNYMDVYDTFVKTRQRVRQTGEYLKLHHASEPNKLSALWTHGWPLEKVYADSSSGYLHASRLADTQVQLLAVTDRNGQPITTPFVLGGSSGRTDARLLIGKDGDGAPIWVPFHVVIHRPLPEGTILRSASYICERVGSAEHWRLVLVAETPRRQIAVRPTRRVAVEIAWRQVPGGMRFAVWRDEGGNGQQEILSSDWLGRFRKVESIRSIRDQRFNIARATLGAWLRQHPHPDWLRDETATLPHWRSPGRLAALVLRWRVNRFAGDEEIFPSLDGRWDPTIREYSGWRAKDKHLWNYESNLRDKLLAHRTWLYRELAAKLARQYTEIVVENFDLSKAAQDEEDELPDAVHYQRFIAGLSTLRLALKNAIEREGGTVQIVSAVNTTRRCHRCECLNDVNPNSVIFTCIHCGSTWDVDVNACENLLHSARLANEVVA